MAGEQVKKEHGTFHESHPLTPFLSPTGGEGEVPNHNWTHRGVDLLRQAERPVPTGRGNCALPAPASRGREGRSDGADVVVERACGPGKVGPNRWRAGLAGTSRTGSKKQIPLSLNCGAAALGRSFLLAAALFLPHHRLMSWARSHSLLSRQHRAILGLGEKGAGCWLRGQR
jgi:hypothetical protein